MAASKITSGKGEKKRSAGGVVRQVMLGERSHACNKLLSLVEREKAGEGKGNRSKVQAPIRPGINRITMSWGNAIKEVSTKNGASA